MNVSCTTQDENELEKQMAMEWALKKKSLKNWWFYMGNWCARSGIVSTVTEKKEDNVVYAKQSRYLLLSYFMTKFC